MKPVAHIYVFKEISHFWIWFWWFICLKRSSTIDYALLVPTCWFGSLILHAIYFELLIKCIGCLLIAFYYLIYFIACLHCYAVVNYSLVYYCCLCRATLSTLLRQRKCINAFMRVGYHKHSFFAGLMDGATILLHPGSFSSESCSQGVYTGSVCNLWKNVKRGSISSAGWQASSADLLKI